MNLIGLSSPGRGELWGWRGTDKNGVTRNYQTHGPDVSASSMHAHLQRAYPNLRITEPERIKSGQYKPPNPDDPVDRHAFMHGVRDRFRDGIIAMRPDERRGLIQMAMNLPKMVMPKVGVIDDPMKTAVVYALAEIAELQPTRKLSIRERYQSIRT